MSGGLESVLLADENPDYRELLVNQLLMSGAGQVQVATGAGELPERLLDGEYDLIVLSLPIFEDARTAPALARYRGEHRGAIIVLLEDVGGELSLRTLTSIDTPLCVLRSAAHQTLKRLMSARAG